MKISVAQNMIDRVRWLETLSQTVRLEFRSLDDGMTKGNIDTPAVLITPITASDEAVLIIAAGALVGLGLALMLAGLIRAEPPSSTGSSTPLWTRGVRRWTALTARRRVWLLGAIGTGVIGGMITAKTVKYTRTGKPMAFVTLEDLVGTVEVIVFPRDYERYHQYLEEENVVFVKGRVSEEDEASSKLICEKVIPFGQKKQELW